MICLANHGGCRCRDDAVSHRRARGTNGVSEAKHLCDLKPRPFAEFILSRAEGLRVTIYKVIYVNLNNAFRCQQMFVRVHHIRAEDIQANAMLLAGKAYFHFTATRVARSAVVHGLFEVCQ